MSSPGTCPGSCKPAARRAAHPRDAHVPHPAGGSFDGVALDVESLRLKSVGLRTTRLLALTRILRAEAGEMPVAAITYPSRGFERHPRLVAGFPWQAITALVDAWIPMTYTGGGFHGYDATYGYVARSLRLLRAAVGPDVPVHAAGGVANRMNAEELKAFVDAVQDEGTVTGWSLYDFQTTGPKAWAALAPLAPDNRRERLEDVEQAIDPRDGSESEPLEDRPRHLSRMGDEHGGAALGRLAGARCDERPVGAAATRLGSVAPPKRSSRRACTTRIRLRTGWSSTNARNVEPTTPSVSKSASACSRPTSSPDAAERLVLDTAREDELVDRGDAPGPRARRVAGGVGGLEHHSDRHGLVLVRDDAEGGEPFHEIQRRAGLAELPFGARAAV